MAKNSKGEEAFPKVQVPLLWMLIDKISFDVEENPEVVLIFSVLTDITSFMMSFLDVLLALLFSLIC